MGIFERKGKRGPAGEPEATRPVGTPVATVGPEDPTPPDATRAALLPGEEAPDATIAVDADAPRELPVYDGVVGVLVCRRGRLAGELFALYDGDNPMGRSETNRVVLPSQRISRQHALIVHLAGRFALRPTSPRNPTLLNGVETDGAELQDGDRIRLGDCDFVFRTIPPEPCE